MADNYGAVTVPVQVPAGAFPPVMAVGDPLLGYVADFIKTVMNTYCQAAWASVTTQPTAPNIVSAVFVHNPKEEVFKRQALPALYVFRDENLVDNAEFIADEYRMSHGLLKAYWVMPPAPQDTKRNRWQIINAIVKVLDEAIERGRDPSWVVPSDPNPQAATYGSLLDVWAGWTIFNLQKARRAALRIDRMATDGGAKGAGAPALFDMLEMTFFVEEKLTVDINLASTAPNNFIGATITSPDQGTGLGTLITETALYQ
jgi:hypothetical protein